MPIGGVQILCPVTRVMVRLVAPYDACRPELSVVCASKTLTAAPSADRVGTKTGAIAPLGLGVQTGSGRMGYCA